MRARPSPVQLSRRLPPRDGPIRLDLVTNPYGPSIRVQEALASADDTHLPQDERVNRVRDRLAGLVGVPAGWLVLANGIDELMGAILLVQNDCGPLINFPPTDSSLVHLARQFRVDVNNIARSHRYALDLDESRLADVPPGSLGVVLSPNDPTGTELSSQDAVRLTRRCHLVVVDERHGGYGARSLIPFVREFDNLIVIRTMETWAALPGFPLAYGVAPPRLARRIAEYIRPSGLTAGSLIAAEATLDDLPYVMATVQRVREEKSRLYRTLRKLNMVRPLPSWANYLLVRVERGNAEWFHRELAERNILVHLPQQPELEGYLRISGTRPEHTSALKQALIEIASAL